MLTGTLNEALDATAWLALLALFQLETGFGGRIHSAGRAIAIRVARVVAAAAVGAAAIGYVRQREWLDAVNTGIWIAVVILLELEVRVPGALARHRAWFTATAVVLYAGLAILVLIWGMRREWFDAYDALLWLAAFAMIEMDILRLPRRRVS